MDEDECAKITQIVGLSVSDLLKVRKKLMVLGIDIKEILEYLDRCNLQLMAEKSNRIKKLESQIRRIKEACDE